MLESLFIGEDHLVKWTGATDESDGSFLNAATVNFVLKDLTGAAVTGGSGTCNYVAASNGNYVGVLQSTASVALGSKYVCEVTLEQGGYNAKRFIDLYCRKRGSE